MSLKLKPAVDFGETWSVLKKTVKDVVTLGNVPREVWYKGISEVLSLCEGKSESEPESEMSFAEKLHQETKKLLKEHVESLYIQVNGTSQEQLLTVYYTLWQQYSQGIDYLDNLYSSLNEKYLRKPRVRDEELLAYFEESDCELPDISREIGEMGLDLWVTCIIEPLRVDLMRLLLAGIHCDRTGQSLYEYDTLYEKSSTIQGVIRSLVLVKEKEYRKMRLHQEVFERPFLEATREYFRQEASRLLQECTISLYMEKVLQRRDEEDLRSRKFLHASSYSKVRSEFEKIMIADHLAAIHNQCPTMVEQNQYEDLRNAYELLKSIPGSLTVLVSLFKEHIKQEGLQTVTNLSGDRIFVQFVEGMFSFHSKYKEIIKTVFSNDQLFSSALDRACAEVVNHPLNTGQDSKSHPELLARYCDSILKKATKACGTSTKSTEVDDKLTQCITVFKYIDDKDVFQNFYSLLLATRLIHQRSRSMDAEEAMINRLKLACGFEFTNKLHQMLTDMSVSSDLNNKFNLLNKDRIELGLDFSINVLKTGAWPRQVCPTDFAVPQELEKSIQEFEDFYSLQFNGRKLTWLYHLSCGELKLKFKEKCYFITMGTFQMAMLLAFQKTDSLTCGELMESTKLNSDQFKNTVQSLVNAKLLAVTGDNVEVFPASTVISLNLDYSNKRTKFRINNTAKKEQTVQETEMTHSFVNVDRKHDLQATIVRIMKARKTLKHTDLIREVLSLTKDRFVPSRSMIKKNIEALIEKEYLERTSSSTDEYNYVA